MTPEQEDQVRRALEQTARVEPTPPLPDEVARRLDDVLADLAAERAARSRPRTSDAAEPATTSPSAAAPGDELSRRRRARTQQWLVAAAVVVVLGGGAIAATRGLGGGAGSSDSTTSAGRPSPDSDSSRSLAQRRPGAGSPSPSPSARVQKPGELAAPAAGLVRLHRASLADDVRAATQDGRLRRDASGVAPDQQAAGGGSSVRRCRAPALPPGGRRSVVLLDGRPATLVLTAPDEGRRVARVYGCDSPDRPLARVTIRTR